VRYFVKRLDRSEIVGPFDVEELNRQINQRTIGSNWLATSDLGESLDSLRHSPGEDWFWIAKIPGVIGVECPKINKRRERSFLKMVMLMLLIGVILFFTFFLILRMWLGNIPG